MERKTLKKKKPVKRAESHSDTGGSHQGLPSSCTESQISRGMVGKTDQKAVKKAPELVKCPKVTFPMWKRSKGVIASQGK